MVRKHTKTDHAIGNETLVKIINQELLADTWMKAKLSPRKRMNFNLHELSDTVQRMLNAIEPGSYIQPHRHLSPPKMEVFMILKGKGCILIFNDEGEITETFLLEEGGDLLGVEITPGVWHTVISMEAGTVFFEVKDGPYEALTDKDFAPWAPTPDERRDDYLVELKIHCERLYG